MGLRDSLLFWNEKGMLMLMMGIKINPECGVTLEEYNEALIFCKEAILVVNQADNECRDKTVSFDEITESVDYVKLVTFAQRLSKVTGITPEVEFLNGMAHNSIRIKMSCREFGKFVQGKFEFVRYRYDVRSMDQNAIIGRFNELESAAYAAKRSSSLHGDVPVLNEWIMLSTIVIADSRMDDRVNTECGNAINAILSHANQPLMFNLIRSDIKHNGSGGPISHAVTRFNRTTKAKLFGVDNKYSLSKIEFVHKIQYVFYKDRYRYAHKED